MAQPIFTPGAVHPVGSTAARVRGLKPARRPFVAQGRLSAAPRALPSPPSMPPGPEWPS